MRPTSTLAAALLLLPSPALAQWGRDAAGELQYTFDYATSIGFGCAFAWEGCVASGNILTFRSETGTLRFTFTGTSGVFTATNQAQTFDLGTLHVVEEGRFAFPTNGSEYALYLVFGLSVNTTTPLATAGLWRGGYIRGDGIVDGRSLEAVGNEYGFAHYFRFPTTPPPPRGASVLLFDHDMPPGISVGSADYVLTARVGLVPEPSTWVMLGTGLLALGGLAARRRPRWKG